MLRLCLFDGDEAVAWCQFGSPRELADVPTTARSTRPLSTSRPTTGSPASSWNKNTGAKESPRRPFVVPWI